MRRQVCDQIEAKLRAKGLDVQRVYDGPKGYVLKAGSVVIATKTAGEKMLGKGRGSVANHEGEESMSRPMIRGP